MKNVWFQTNSYAHSKVVTDFLMAQGYTTKNNFPHEGFYNVLAFGIDDNGQLISEWPDDVKMRIVDVHFLDPNLHTQEIELFGKTYYVQDVQKALSKLTPVY